MKHNFEREKMLKLEMRDNVNQNLNRFFLCVQILNRTKRTDYKSKIFKIVKIIGVFDLKEF